MHIIFVPFGEEKKYEALGWVYSEHCPRGDGFIAGDIYRWEGGGQPVYPEEPDVDAMRDDAIERHLIEADYSNSPAIESE